MDDQEIHLGCFRLLADPDGTVGKQGSPCKAVCEKDGFEGVAVGTVVELEDLPVLSGDEAYIARLEKRIAELKGLTHPGIVKCLGCFCVPDPPALHRYVIVSEWLEGESLETRLQREPCGMDADECLRIGEKLLSAMSYVSSMGVTLSRLAPGDVFLCKDGGVKIVDFVLPSALDEFRCIDWGRSLNYVAPDFLAHDIFRGFGGDERSDIFSLGVVLHEMITGRLPYKDQDCTDMRRWLARWQDWAIGNAAEASPVFIDALTMRSLYGAHEVLEKALEPTRFHRYQTFAEFAAAFKGIRCRELTHGDNTWRLLRYVGRGGFSEVFKARNVKTGQVVAIKHLLKREYADRFRREARALSQLNDSCIVRFISFFEKEMYGFKLAHLVMEYLDGMPGQSLRQVLARSDLKPLPRTLVLQAFARYAHGLSVMHAQELVHRDIKPSNLYFPQESIERAAIMDLAIVRDVNGTMIAGPVPCTLDYAPPEIATSESRGDAGMDIYALGLSLYEALSGKMAYPRLPTGTDGLLAFVKRAQDMTRPTLDESSYSDLPDLVRLVREMTEPDVTKRLKDATEVERRLCALRRGAESAPYQPCPDDLDGGESRPNGRACRSATAAATGLCKCVSSAMHLFLRRRKPSGKNALPVCEDVTCRTSDCRTDNLVSETEDGTDNPAAFLNLHGHATIHGFRMDPTPFVAEGGQGRVFKAECVEEGRLGLHKGEVVALKFVEETDRSPSFEDFEKSVTYLREIRSPHVPRYYGCFRVGRWVSGKLKRFRMTVMEYLDGADLGYRVRVRSPMFYADEIMYVLDQLLEGLCELSAAGIVHRDIKPSNVFICRDGTVKLIDFDTALIRGIDLCPKNRKIVGTPEFAAPDYLTEGFRGDEISDVFSVGMTLYYMVHGMSPHRAKGTLSGRMDEQRFSSFWRTREPDSRSKTWWIKGKESFCRRSVPLLGLPQVFSKALASDRDCRFTSFEDFRRSLKMVDFVRARHGKNGYSRVISGWECISGAGAGYSCVYGRSERGELCNWGIEGLRLVQPEQMEEKERSALLEIFLGWWNCSDPSLMFGGLHEGCVDIRDLCPLCGRTPLIMTEKFAAENVKVVQTSFAEIKSLEEWRREVADHEFQMQLS